MTVDASRHGDARRFFDALGASLIHWQWFADDKRARVFPGHRVMTIDDAIGRLGRVNDGGAGIFAVVNKTDGNGRSARNVVAVRALFIDCDGFEPPALHLPPSIVVDSKAGPHIYWIVGDCPISAFRGAQKRLANHYGSDGAVCDLSRVMRVPGFVHRKGDPFAVRIRQIDAGRRYTLADVVDGLDPLPPPPPPPPRRAFRGDVGSLDVVDLFRGAGLYKRQIGEGKHAVICPWEAGHSEPDHNPRSSQTSTAIWQATPSRPPGFCCQHASCQGRRFVDVLQALGVHQIEAACTKTATRGRIDRKRRRFRSLAQRYDNNND